MSLLFKASRLDHLSGPFEVLLQGSIGTPRPSDLAARLMGLGPVASIRGRNRTKADILVYRLDGVRIALKDFSRRPPWIRQTVGRISTRREAAAYRATDGIVGIPRFLGRVGPFALATEWVDATPLSRLEPTAVAGEVFDRLRAILDALHARGIAIGDLHQSDVLVGTGNAVHVVDLATAFARRDSNRLRRSIFDLLREQDLIALARMRARFTGGDPQAAVETQGARGARWHRRGRRIKACWDRLRNGPG